ncbi:CbtA family protein, partial [Campylobacter coli]|nr:CbtA family protein [Campylobacter coli]
GLFSLVFAFVHGRVSSLSPRSTAALLALAGFVAIVLVPCIKYPMNPPAVGSPDTIGARTELFFVMLVVSLGALAAAVGLAKRLYAQHGAWNATLMAGAAYV